MKGMKKEGSMAVQHDKKHRHKIKQNKTSKSMGIIKESDAKAGFQTDSSGGYVYDTLFYSLFLLSSSALVAFTLL